jgi:hypothetical protein
MITHDACQDIDNNDVHKEEPSNYERFTAKQGEEPMRYPDVALQRGTRELNEPERRAGRLWGFRRVSGATSSVPRGSQGQARGEGHPIEGGQ